ncbi:MAG: hypothetical protein RSD40_02385, partial [Bacilli bacterium]
MEFFILLIIGVFVILYRQSNGGSVYKFFSKTLTSAYNKYAPYSFKTIRDKVKKLGLEYTPSQYMTQVALFAGGAFIVSYLYFYNIVVSLIYIVIAIAVIPYLSFLRYKRIYSEFIFEQIQVYTTNVIMEFTTTQSFVKALEGVVESGVLEDPVRADVQMMIDMAYENGDIEASINYMNDHYDYYITRNMHQLFLQITKEGSRDSKAILDNMLLDIDVLVEGVYRDRSDRSNFHKQFLQYGVMLYLLVMLIQLLLGTDKYAMLLDNPLMVI